MVAPVLLLFLSTAYAIGPVPSVSPNHISPITFSRIAHANDVQSNGPPPAVPAITDHTVQLRRVNATSTSAHYVRAARNQALARKGVSKIPSTGAALLDSVDGGQIFLAQVIAGGNEYELVVDTGSSDVWLVAADFICEDPNTGNQYPQQDCGFASTYNSSASGTFTSIQDENFNITYADGEYLLGRLGYEDFSMAGIPVRQQEFGIAEIAGWIGDYYSSGLVGFAYSILTSAYPGTNYSADVRGQADIYNPLFTTMFNESVVPPVFSLAIDRDQTVGGILALGGIPQIAVSTDFVSTPLISVGVYPNTNTPVYEFYSINIDGFAVSTNSSEQFTTTYVPGSTKTPLIGNNTLAIVDSGTSLLYASDQVAAAVANGFNPPATYDSTYGTYYVDCNATAPVVGVGINNKIFYINSYDLVVGLNAMTCVSGVQPSIADFTILGDVWMKNVLAVFDIGNSRMQFAAREFYSLTNTSQTDSGMI